MQPAVSTRIFGGIPGQRELVLVRRARLYALELWTEPLAGAPPGAWRELADAVRGEGLQVPCVHLPVRSLDGPPLDAGATDPSIRREVMLRGLPVLDLAARMGARIAVVHASEPSDELWQLSQEALVRQLRLAVEINSLPDASPQKVRRMAWDLGPGHGVCLDLSSFRPQVESLRGEDWAVRWLEVSGVRAGRRHLPPDESEVALLPWVEAAAAMPFVGYEVWLHGRPGPTELELVLRRVNAWHRHGGMPTWGEVSPFLPLG